MISKGSTVYQTSYGLVREGLRDVLEAVVESGPRAGVGMGSVSWRACAALRRRCQIRVAACYWLQQPDETLLLGLMARELKQLPHPQQERQR